MQADVPGLYLPGGRIARRKRQAAPLEALDQHIDPAASDLDGRPVSLGNREAGRVVVAHEQPVVEVHVVDVDDTFGLHEGQERRRNLMVDTRHGHTRRCRHISNVIWRAFPYFGYWLEPICWNTDHPILPGKPDAADGFPPKRLGLDNLAELIMIGTVTPIVVIRWIH